MKKTFSIFILTILLITTGCSSNQDIEKQEMYFYYGQSDSWIGSYSITEINSLHYDSLVIQFLFDKDDMESEIGPIEHQLIGSNIEMSSEYALNLQACGSLHVPGIVNMEQYNIEID